jgi:hypothetical protein
MNTLLALVAASAIAAATSSEPIVGVWDLAGLEANDRNPSFARLTIGASGEFTWEVSEADATEPFRVFGVWTVSGDQLTLFPHDAAKLKAARQEYRIRWEGRALILKPTDEDDAHGAPLRFEPA